MDKIAVFVGATGFNTGSILAGVDTNKFFFFPPIKRGDLDKLPSSFTSILIVDGFFHKTPAVGHIEIRDTLKNREVYGCSSMGAIRAFEMRNFGMVGLGQIYEMFFQFEDFTDAELAQLLEPEPPFRPITEPLVHYRYLLGTLLHRGDINHNEHLEILEELTNRYYGDLDIRFFKSLLGKYVSVELLSAVHSNFQEFRLKTKDYISALKFLNDKFS
jgi:hypothetical protein